MTKKTPSTEHKRAPKKRKRKEVKKAGTYLLRYSVETVNEKKFWNNSKNSRSSKQALCYQPKV